MWRHEQWTRVPGQFFAPFRLLRIPINSCRGDALFEPVQLEFEVSRLLLEVFELLRASGLAVCDGYQLDQYLIMLDERAHSTEDGLEGREPIGGLFRNIEQDLREISDSLPLCCDIQTVIYLTRWKALNPSHGFGSAPLSEARGFVKRRF